MIQKKSVRSTSGFTVTAFLLPSMVGLAVFIFLPIIMAFGMSFTNFSGGPRFRFTGLKNYIQIFSSQQFIQSLAVTGNFTIWSVLLQIVLGLTFALILNSKFAGRNIFRGIFFMPNVLSSVAISLVFMLVLDPKRGPINQFLVSLGLPAPEWLAGEKTALPSIIMVTVWQNFGYYMVLFLGGLQTISSTLYEAAAIDGAGPVRRFFSVTIPGLSPVMFFSVTIAVIRAFQVFDQIFTMTGGQAGGGPAGATSVLVFNIYKDGFGQLRFGYASAESVILLIIILAITIIQQAGQKRWVTYDVV